MYASITIDVLTSHLNDTYTYHVPEELERYIGIGSRVIVDFGVRKVLGYVIELKNDTDYEGQVRDIVEVLDYSKELSEEQIEIAKKISSDTKSPLIHALDCLVPSFLKTKYRKFVTIKNEEELDPNILMLFGDKKRISLSSDLVKEYPKIRKEIDLGNLDLDYDVYTYGKRKSVKVYGLNPNSESIYKDFTGARYDLVEFLKNNPYVSLDTIRENVNISKYLVESLVKQEIILTKTVYELIEKDKDKVSLRNVDFSFNEKIVVDKYKSLSNKPFLLYTNSEEFSLKFYLDLCVTNILNNKKVLIVTPTYIINYTIYHYLKKRLNGFDCLVFSGDMSNSDFYYNYMKLRHNDCEVVVTTKVGALLPMDDIGVIVVVDEANFNYISEQTPKYNLVELLKFRAKWHNAKIILASNPLTVENYYNYFQAKYDILKYLVPNEHKATLVNMYDEILNDREVISKVLENKIRETLNDNKQVMLILNAKGYSNHLVCRSCGTVATCPKCNIPLTYYKEKNEVKCRYCGSKLESLKCKCGEDSYSMYGFGLEKINETVKNLFPGVRTIVIDSDTLKDYNDYTNFVVKIESGDCDIIIGTNNIMSLNNYSNVALTGFIDIDKLLNISDYKASYNVFYLLSNAIKNTDVVVQGFNLEHYAIKYGIEADFVSFYNEEIKVREMFNYPPYYEINKLIITGDFNNMYYAANYFKKCFNTLFGNNQLALGPTYVKIKRGVMIIIKHNDFDKLSRLLDEVNKKFEKSKIEFSYERYPRSF